jgi:phage-related protein
MVAIRYILKGHKFSFYALEEGDEKKPSCELLEFLESLDPKERAGLLGRMSRDADHGPPRNEEQSKDVGGDVFELKFKAIRILWFYDAGKMIVCSHGFFKGAKKIQNAQIAKAKERRTAYQKQKTLGKPIEKRGEP